MRITCYFCGKNVSTELPEDTVFRAVAECPECIKSTKKDREKYLAELEMLQDRMDVLARSFAEIERR